MQAFNNLTKLKELLLYSPSLSSAATEESDQLSDAVISEADGDADSERHDDDTDSERENDDVDSDRDDDNVAVKENITELSLISSDSFFCCVS